MTTYVMLANWTEQGILKVKDSPRRLDAAKKALKDMSGEFKYFFLTMGDYDMVAIYEAPDDAVAARFSIQLGMLGNIRTQTLKAFPEAAYREIIASLNERTRRNKQTRESPAGSPPAKEGYAMQFTVGFKLKSRTSHV